jgi:thiamine biosynthesis lipoprotein
VGVADPFRPGNDILDLHLAGGGVATSGRDRRRWKAGRQWRHHLINPLTGLPAETDLVTATVIAEDVVEAEMAAKTVFLLGSRDGSAWLADRPRLAGFLVLEDGQVLAVGPVGQYIH